MHFYRSCLPGYTRLNRKFYSISSRLFLGRTSCITCSPQYLRKNFFSPKLNSFSSSPTIGRIAVVICSVTTRKTRPQRIICMAFVIPRARPARSASTNPNPTLMPHNKMSKVPRKLAEVLDTLKSQITGVNPISNSPDRAINAQSTPVIVWNLAFTPPRQENM